MRDSGPFSPLAERVDYTSRLTAIGVPLFVAATAAVMLVRTPYSASALTDYPDEVEYALGSHRLVNEGRYEIVLQEQRLPPRYPPWFSSLIIAPAYLVVGSDPGVAIIPITLFAIAGVLLAVALGTEVSGRWGGAIAGLGVGLLPVYWYWGRHVMTDVPCTVLILGACLIYLRGDAADLRSSLAGGALIGLAALLRPPSASCILPFLWRTWIIPGVTAMSQPAPLSPVAGERTGGGGGLRRRIFQSACLLTPMGFAAAATMFYNARTFGSPFRSGYHFWCSVPYDYGPLTFSLRYVRNNLSILWQEELPYILGALAVVLVARFVLRFLSPVPIAGSPAESRLAHFLFFGTGPLVLFHLVYFFQEARLQLPAIVLLVILTGAAAGQLVRLPPAWTLALLPAVFLGVAYWRVRNTEFPPVRRIVADEIREHTAPDAVIISATDPVYLEYMIHPRSTSEKLDPAQFWTSRSQRRVLPLTRGVEYAGKLLTPVRIPNPNPRPVHWTDHRCAGLVAGGAREAVPWVALEQLDRLVEIAGAGVPVFLETATLIPADGPAVDVLRERFQFVKRSGYLTELRPGSDTSQ